MPLIYRDLARATNIDMTKCRKKYINPYRVKCEGHIWPASILLSQARSDAFRDEIGELQDRGYGAPKIHEILRKRYQKTAIKVPSVRTIGNVMSKREKEIQKRKLAAILGK
jgi:hypothetical protein